MLKYCRAQSGQAYPSVHLDIWLVRYPYLWDIELNTRRGTLGLQAIKYYFFYFINTIGLYWQEKEQMNEWVNDWKEKDPKSTKCGGTKVQDEKMRRIISKTNDGCNFQHTESSVIAFFRACGRPMKNLSAVDFCSQPQEIPLPKPTNLRCFFSYFGFLLLLQSATKLLTHSPFQSSITPILPSFSFCKLTYLPPSPKKRCCIVIPWTFSYKQATLSGWGGFC